MGTIDGDDDGKYDGYVEGDCVIAGSMEGIIDAVPLGIVDGVDVGAQLRTSQFTRVL